MIKLKQFLREIYRNNEKFPGYIIHGDFIGNAPCTYIAYDRNNKKLGDITQELHMKNGMDDALSISAELFEENPNTYRVYIRNDKTNKYMAWVEKK